MKNMLLLMLPILSIAESGVFINSTQAKSITSNQLSMRVFEEQLPNKVALTYGVRPMYLIEDMDESPLKKELQQCEGQTPKRSSFSIAHRGAPMQFPEHTLDGYLAAARMGAGVMECDITFTKDNHLVCRHSQNDLHATTNILKTPLAQQCTVPPKFNKKGMLLNADNIECRTSDITLGQFNTLKGKMDAADKSATSIDEYMNATANWRTDLYMQNGQVMSLDNHITMTEKLGIKHTPELKNPAEKMPFNGYTVNSYRQSILDNYKKHNVKAENFYPQSFDYDTVKYWLKKSPKFAYNAVYLVQGNDTFEKNNPTTWDKHPNTIKADGINIIAPASWMLVTTNSNNKLVPSEYAKAINKSGLKTITWTIERSGPLSFGGGWYYTGLDNATNNDGDMMNYIDVLAQDVGVIGIFSDWPATVTYYANCKGLK